MGQPVTLRAALPGLGRLVRRLWPYVRRERPLIVVSLLALYAEIGLRLLEPWPLKVVLDHVVGAGHHDRWVDRVLAALDPGTLLALAAAGGVARPGPPWPGSPPPPPPHPGQATDRSHPDDHHRPPPHIL